MNQAYPQVLFPSIPIGNLLAGIALLEYGMDKHEQRRIALKRLVDGFGKGGIAQVAAKIGKDASYVSRMLYPEGKDGKKRIGEDSVDVLNEKFPGWLSNTDADIAASKRQNHGAPSEIERRRAEKLPEPLSEIIALAKTMSDRGRLLLLGQAQLLAQQNPIETAPRKQAK